MMQIKNSSLYSRFFKVVYTCIFCLTMLFSVFLFSLNASAADNNPNTEATTSADNKSNNSSVSGNIYYTNPETGYVVRIEDDAALLTDYERTQLADLMKDITQYGNAAFKSILTNSYSTTGDYAYAYYAQIFQKNSGTVFLIDMAKRKIWIHSNGEIYKTITESYADTITDNIYTYASKKEYYNCASKAFEQELALLKGSKIRQPMKYTSNILLALIIALFANYGIVRLLTKQKKPKSKQLISGAFVHQAFNDTQFQFINQTRVYSPPSSSGGSSSSGGGSSSSGDGGSSGGGGGGGGHSF